MLKEDQVKRVKELLGKCSEREIAITAGVSRYSVAKISSGKWRKKKRHPRENVFEEGPREKCGVCGAVVAQPCLKCAIVELLHSAKRSGPADFSAIDEITLKLRGEHRIRYLELRRSLEAQNAAVQKQPVFYTCGQFEIGISPAFDPFDDDIDLGDFLR